MSTVLTNPVFKESDPFLAHFERLEAGPASKLPAWVHSLHKTGIAHFAELGFPSPHDEEWRFTNVAPIRQRPFKPVLLNSRHGLAQKDVARFFGYPCDRLVFLDGHYSAALSTVVAKPAGAKVGSLASALTIDTEMIEHHLARHARPADNAFAALNTAFFQDGAFVLLPPGAVLAEPIHLLFIALTGEVGATAHPRNLIIAQKHSQVTVVEQYVNWADGPYFTNAVTELVVGEGAVVEHGRIQAESREAFHVATVQAHQERDSRWVSHSISVGSRLARHDIRSRLAGDGADCLLNGLYLVRGNQLVDHHTVIDHAQPHGTSHEFYHGILDERAKGVFNGKIFVRKDAQKTDAKQTNRNLLLSDEATINTKPQLEIFADDVKCTHGATVGRLDEEAVFYLRARGLDAETARQMLMRAFGAEILERVSLEALRTKLDDHLCGWLAQLNGQRQAA